MNRVAFTVLPALAIIATSVAAQEPRKEARHGDAADIATDVRLYHNLGSHQFTIGTSVPAAQEYFNQGLRLLYAFNHAESARSFRHAELLDPSCGMCGWGVALALSPNINAPMDSSNGAAAYHAIQRALTNLDNASDREQAYIRALAQRFSRVPPADRAHLDSAYARAMRQVADRFRSDDDAQVLYADALMNLSPWNYWVGGEPRPGTHEILARLEYAIRNSPDNPGACHLFIHAVEAYEPARAVECAERLAALMPGAGHIVHMPGHIYIRVGRYADAIEANKHAVHADESYLEGPYVSHRGVYPQGYYPHNYHFMSFAASMAGNSETAIYAARKVIEKVGLDIAREVPWLEAVTPIVYTTLVTFGRWDTILNETLPPSDLRYMTAFAHYARGMAFAAKEQWSDAWASLDSITTIVLDFFDGDNRTALTIAQHALLGEIALQQGDPDRAVRHLSNAVELEDQFLYGEPPTWYYPIRQSLGKALLAAGRPELAEKVYREDLERFPDNGWSLFGLYQSLRGQNKALDADKVKAQFDNVWQHADVELKASRF